MFEVEMINKDKTLNVYLHVNDNKMYSVVDDVQITNIGLGTVYFYFTKINHFIRLTVFACPFELNI